MKNLTPNKDIPCDIAYDKKRQRYVAYNVENSVVAVGVCVISAIEAYNEAERLVNFYEPDEEFVL